MDPIDSTITFDSEILASGIIKAKDKNGVDVSDTDPLVQLLRNPNENQNTAEFIKEWFYYFRSHGWTYVVPQSSSIGYEFILNKGTKTQIYNVDPDNVKWGNFWSSVMNFLGVGEKDKIQFDYKPLGFKKISYKNVVSFIDVRQNPERPWMGVSRLLALKPNIENYMISLQAKKNMLKKSGSFLISLDSKADDMGLDSMTGTGKMDDKGNPEMTTHKKVLEDQLRKTGIFNDSNMGMLFSGLPLKVTQLSQGLEDIDYDAKAVQDARIIMNKYNLPTEFQNLTVERSKYANRDAAMMEVVQNNIQPVGNLFCEKMQKAFKSENKLWMDFSHLPIFTKDKATQITTMASAYDLYAKMKADGNLTDEEFNQKLKENGITK